MRLDELSETFFKVGREIDRATVRREYGREVKAELSRAFKGLHEAVARELSSSVAGLDASTVAKALRGRVYRRQDGFCVFTGNHGRRAMWPTGRLTQPLLPLLYWYEWGIKGPRQTRGRRGRKVHGTGVPAVNGIHALTGHDSELGEVARLVEIAVSKIPEDILRRIYG